MNELIKIDNSGKTTARELYDFLELNPSNFARWAITNIENDDFYTKDVDWVGVFTMKSGNEVKDYNLTIDFAKHLCMLSRSDRGKQARNYFVEVEKRSNVPAVASIEDLIILQAQSMKEVKLKLVQQGEAIKQLEAKITNIPTEYFTIAGYASLRGIKVDISKAGLFGKKASKLSHEFGVDIGKISDPRFGRVNTYHTDILKEVFGC